jgi:hypothetical protein
MYKGVKLGQSGGAPSPGERDPSSLGSALLDTAKAVGNAGVEANPLVGAASAFAMAYNAGLQMGGQSGSVVPVLSDYTRFTYDSPAFGTTVEIGVGLVAGRAAGSIGSLSRATESMVLRETFALCFVAGTLVHTADGPKRIEDVRVGDLVAARDELTGATRWQPVVRLFRHKDQETLSVSYVDSQGEAETVGVTGEHPFRVEGRGWIAAGALVAGDKIHRLDGDRLEVTAVQKNSAQQDTYNFEVAEFHTYFVGALGAWVHNACQINAGAAGGAEQAAYVVTSSGVAIPAKAAGLKSNLSVLTEASTNPASSRKFIGADSQGPLRVRIEKGHPADPSFTGKPDPLHTVDHLHIDRRANGTSGPWGSTEKTSYGWPF